jgi:hypothetical protein
MPARQEKGKEKRKGKGKAATGHLENPKAPAAACRKDKKQRIP